jgi:hypothetical protein
MSQTKKASSEISVRQGKESSEEAQLIFFISSLPG